MTVADRPLGSVLEKPEYRVEGPLKVTGRAKYAADFWRPGTLWAKFLMSPIPHGRIVSIDTSAAKAMPGVHAVLTGEDIGRVRQGRTLQDWPILAWDRVRFIGERVAAVAAETEEVAEAAARAIEVEYEDLPAVFDPVEALQEGAPILHDPAEAATYKFLAGQRRPAPHPNVQGYSVFHAGVEDTEQAFAQAARVFESSWVTPRQHQGYIEPHATLVWIEEDGRLHVITTNKSPFLLRSAMVAAFGLPPEQVVVDAGFIGGDFGGKGTSIDEFPCYYLAKATGRPIKAVMSYVDELQAANPRHSSVIRLKTGVDTEGRFVAHTSDVYFNGGAYAAGKPLPSLIMEGDIGALGCYEVPNRHCEVRTVYTNEVPGGHQRAPGEVQGHFAGESHVDMIARELGVDPLEFRLKNAVRPGHLGAAVGGAGGRYREARGAEMLEAVKQATRWGEAPLPAHRGRGVTLAVREMHGGNTSVDMRLLPDGRIEVLTGLPDQGAGAYTVLRRVAASTLDVEPERVDITRGLTDTARFDMGAGGSRVTWVVGEATHAAARTMKQRLQDLAAEVMGWPADRVEIQGDRFVVAGGREDESAPFAEVAERITRGGPIEITESYAGGAHGEHDLADHNFSAYVAEVDVDPDTGRVDVRDVWMAMDVGTIINPVGHQGQLDGGFVSGLGVGMMEELVVEEGKVTTAGLSEYKLPTEMDVPRFHTILLPTSQAPGPFGAKMSGEASTTGVAPAIANAVADAVGARVMSLPISAEKVLAALQG